MADVETNNALCAPDLTGKAVLITAPSTGIGAAEAEAFASQGSQVAINYNASHDAIEKRSGLIPGRNVLAILFQGDLSTAEENAGRAATALRRQS